MTADAFCRWIEDRQWTDTKVAQVLDLSRNTVAKYKTEGAPSNIGYACAAIAFGLPQWGDTVGTMP